jgi:nitrite reductase/ring-hydroxylating ferredoxin subunit
MSNGVEVLKTSDLESGQMKAVTVEGQEILVAQAGDVYYAVCNICPHRGGRLSDGKLNGTVIECPIHGSQFNIVNGRVLRRLNGGFVGKLLGLLRIISSMKAYIIEVEGDSIKIEL